LLSDFLKALSMPLRGQGMQSARDGSSLRQGRVYALREHEDAKISNRKGHADGEYNTVL